MRLMSFLLTTDQMRRKTKTVTRRIGWGRLKPGDRLQACVKCRGVKIPDRQPLAIIEVVSTKRERLDAITAEDVEKEGFPGMSPGAFVEMFTANMKCAPDRYVNRIEFKFVEESCEGQRSTPSNPTRTRSKRRGPVKSSSSSG